MREVTEGDTVQRWFSDIKDFEKHYRLMNTSRVLGRFGWNFMDNAFYDTVIAVEEIALESRATEFGIEGRTNYGELIFEYLIFRTDKIPLQAIAKYKPDDIRFENGVLTLWWD